MEFLATGIEVLIRYILTLRLSDCLDIALMAYGFYFIIGVVHRTKLENLFKGILLFLAALWLSSVFHLQGIHYVLSKLVEWGVLALIILFQPELRRLLEEMGSSKFKFLNPFAKSKTEGEWEQAINQTVLACEEMSKSHTGVLLVFERENSLEDYTRNGTKIDATVSAELLKNIFFVKAPLHDGAVIIRNGRVLAAGCVLPLTKKVNLSRDLGTRHRAGIGMSENADAVVVIVSEETGSISVAVGGQLKRHLMVETLEKILRNELISQEEEKRDKPWLSYLGRKQRKE